MRVLQERVMYVARKSTKDGSSLFTDGQCGEFQFAAADGYDGTLQGFFKLPAHLYVLNSPSMIQDLADVSSCYKLPPNVSMEEGALVEPLSVAVMAVASVARMPHNANVAVFGAGPVGLLYDSSS